jgi:hypothetical protein
LSSAPGGRPPGPPKLPARRWLRIKATRAADHSPADHSPAARSPSGHSHHAPRLIIASALVLVAGLIAGVAGIAAASGAGGSHQVRVPVSYSCKFPSGTYQVTAVVAATFPASVATGTPIDPTGLQVAISLPAQAVTYLRGLSTATVTATASLAVSATSSGTPVPLAWPVKTPAAATLPATPTPATTKPATTKPATTKPATTKPAATGLTLDTSGTAPPAAASATGTVTFSATGLTLLLTPRTASGASTNPPDVAASCQTTTTTTTRLAEVSVTSASASPSPSAHHSAKPAKKKPPKKIKFPKGCGHIKVRGFGTGVCGYLYGYSDVKKLYGASLIGPVLVNVDFAYRHVIKPTKLTAWSSGRIYNAADNGKSVFPPVRSTFLGFGFVPVTATLTLTERGPITIISVSGISKPPYPITVTATSKVTISVSDVSVNGVPLAVGRSCQAEHAARLKLVGHGTNTFPPHGYTLPTGGPLSGFLTIPPFVHCGVTQNLDPLLTGSISGVGNFAKMTQGKLCGPSQPAAWTCPPPVPKPIR